MADIPNVPEDFDMAGQMADMTTNIATQATAAAPEQAAELAGAMMEQMADIPSAPDDFYDPAAKMAESLLKPFFGV